MDVPPREHSRSSLLMRKLIDMLTTLVAPEIYLGISVRNFFDARALAKFLDEKGCRGWTLTHTQFAFANGFDICPPGGEPSLCPPDRLKVLIGDGRIEGPPISEDELKSRGSSDSILKSVAILQIIGFAVQILFQAGGHYQITAIEIMTAGFVLCSTLAYGFDWHRPQNVEYPVFLQSKDVARASGDNEQVANGVILANEEERTGFSPAVHKVECRRTSLDDDDIREAAATNAPIAFMFLSAIGFGIIHCLAWNSPFSSSKERLAWRVCSVATTALPVPMVYQVFLDRIFAGIVFCFLLFLYVIARLTIIILAFTSLRALPANAYETVNWTNYVPHFA